MAGSGSLVLNMAGGMSLVYVGGGRLIDPQNMW